MSYLPYGGGGPGGWLLSGAASVVAHGALIAVMTSSVSQWFVERPIPQRPPDFQITLEQLESDTLAGLVERLGEAGGLDAAEDTETLDPEGELDHEDDFDELPAADPDEAEDEDPDALDPALAEALENTEVEDVETSAAEDVAEAEAEEVTADAAEDLAETEAEETETTEAEDLAEAEAEEVETAEVEDLAEAEEVETTEAEDVAEVETTEAEDLAQPEEIETSQAEDFAEAEVEDIQTAEAEPEAIEAVESTEVETPESTETVDVVDAAPVDAPVDTLGAEAITPDPTTPDVAEAQVLDEVPVVAPTVDDVSAVLPAEDVVLAPADSDPLLSDEGTATIAAVPTLDAVTSEDVAPVVAGDATPVIEDDQVVAAVPVGTVEPDQLAALIPETPLTPGEDDTAPALTAQPIAPEDVTPEEITPDEVTPEEITPDEVTPDEVTPEEIAPEDPSQDSTQTVEATDATPPNASTRTTAGRATVQSRPRVVRRPRAPPSERDLAIGDLLQRIKANTEDNCVIALPRRDGEDGIGLALLAAEDGAMAAFAEAVLVRPEDSEIRQTRTLLDERQCPAISFMAKNRDYPATRIGMKLDNAEVPSGNRVTGVMRGVAGRNLGLFLVDNNGVVQDLERFLSRSEGFVRFDIPVTRVGPLRDTKQLLIAIATQEPLDTLTERSGQRAQAFFEGLSAELTRQAALAIVAFDVR